MFTLIADTCVIITVQTVACEAVLTVFRSFNTIHPSSALTLLLRIQNEIIKTSRANSGVWSTGFTVRKAVTGFTGLAYAIQGVPVFAFVTDQSVSITRETVHVCTICTNSGCLNYCSRPSANRQASELSYFILLMLLEYFIVLKAGCTYIFILVAGITKRCTFLAIVIWGGPDSISWLTSSANIFIIIAVVAV